MSLLANMEHLAAASGVVAVTVDAPQHPRAFRGADVWAPVLDASLGLFALTTEDTIRLVIGQHSVIIQKEHGQTVAVVLPTGHAIAKSLRRMIRRLSKYVRVSPPARPAVTSVAGSGSGSDPATGSGSSSAPPTGLSASSQSEAA